MQGLQFLVEFITALSSTINKEYCDFPRAQGCVETLGSFQLTYPFVAGMRHVSMILIPVGKKEVILHYFVYYPSASSDFC